MQTLKIQPDKINTSDHADDKRKLKRYNVRLKVFRQDDGEMLGYIEDINLSGMNVRSQESLPDMQDIKLFFGADDNEPDAEKISLIVIKVWGAFTDTMPRSHSTGLHFVNPSEDALDAIAELIHDLDAV